MRIGVYLDPGSFLGERSQAQREDPSVQECTVIWESDSSLGKEGVHSLLLLVSLRVGYRERGRGL